MFVLTTHVFGTKKWLKKWANAFIADTYIKLINKKKEIIEQAKQEHKNLSIQNTLFHSVLHDENGKDVVIDIEIIKIEDDLSESSSV